MPELLLISFLLISIISVITITFGDFQRRPEAYWRTGLRANVG